MTEVHPPLTWADLKAWARDNEVPDDALIEDQDDRPIRDFDVQHDDDGVAYLIVQRTWG